MHYVVDSADKKANAGRLLGVDVARALALVGMLMVHFGPKGETDLLGRLYALPHGRASILFVLVAGIGVSLLGRRPEVRTDARLRLFCFALFLLPLGLALEALHHPVAVILHHYAVFYLLGIAAMGLSSRVLAWLAGIASVVGPLIFYAGMMVAPKMFARESAELGDSLVTIFSALLFTGPYPLIVWSGPLLWGMWIGRQDLHEPRVRRRMMWTGAAIAVVAIVASEVLFRTFGEPASNTDWRFIFAHTAHSEMPLWIIGGIGSAVFAFGLIMEISAHWTKLVRPLAMLGQMALTVYVAQVLLLTAAGPMLRQDEAGAALIIVALLTFVATVFAVIWRRYQRRGPVERAMHAVWEAADAMWPAKPQPENRPSAKSASRPA